MTDPDEHGYPQVARGLTLDCIRPGTTTDPLGKVLETSPDQARCLDAVLTEIFAERGLLPPPPGANVLVPGADQVPYNTTRTRFEHLPDGHLDIQLQTLQYGARSDQAPTAATESVHPPANLTDEELRAMHTDMAISEDTWRHILTTADLTREDVNEIVASVHADEFVAQGVPTTVPSPAPDLDEHYFPACGILMPPGQEMDPTKC